MCVCRKQKVGDFRKKNTQVQKKHNAIKTVIQSFIRLQNAYFFVSCVLTLHNDVLIKQHRLHRVHLVQNGIRKYQQSNPSAGNSMCT